MYEKCPEAVGTVSNPGRCVVHHDTSRLVLQRHRDRFRTSTEPDVATLCGRHFVFYFAACFMRKPQFLYQRLLAAEQRDLCVWIVSLRRLSPLHGHSGCLTLHAWGGCSSPLRLLHHPLSSSLCLGKSPWGWVSVPSLPPSSPAQQRNVPVNQLFDHISPPFFNIWTHLQFIRPDRASPQQPLLISSSNAVQSCFTNIKCVLANLQLDLYELFMTCRRGWQEGGLCCSTW